MNQRLENGQFTKIDELYVFIAKDGNGGEGILGGTGHDGVMMPFVFADPSKVELLRPVADRAAVQFGITYEVRHFKLVVTH